MYSNRNYVNTQPFNGPLSGLAGWAGTRRNIHPLTPTLIIKHPLSVSSIYYFPWHPPCSFYVFDINITKKVYCINVGKNGTAGLTNTHQTLLCTFAMSLASIIVLITRQWCLLTARCVTSRLIKKLNALSNQAQGWNLKRRWLLSGRGYSVMTEWNGSFDEMSMQQRFGKISGIWAHRSMHCCKTQKLWPVVPKHYDRLNRVERQISYCWSSKYR